MGKKYSTMLIIVVCVIAIAGIGVGVSFAIWQETQDKPVANDATHMGVINTSAKYLVCDITDGEKHIYTRYYVDQELGSGVFKYSPEDQNRYKDGVSDLTTLQEDSLSATIIGFSDYYFFKDSNTPEKPYEKVGYAIGEVETIEIPNEIPVDILVQGVEGNQYKKVKVESINMMSTEEFKPLLNIRSISIPVTVESILGASFTGCVNLEAVNYNGHTPGIISEYSFIGCAQPRQELLPK